MRAKYVAVLATASVFSLNGVARAALIGVGQSYTPAGTTSATRPELNGTVLEDVTTPINALFGNNVNFVGSLECRVILSSVTGKLNFEYQLTQSPADPSFPEDVVNGVTILNVYGYQTDVDYRTDRGGSVAPATIVRTQEINPIFQSLTWQLPNHLGDGLTTYDLVVLTDATNYWGTRGAGSYERPRKQHRPYHPAGLWTG